MQRFEFAIDISSLEYLPYYRGEVRNILVRCTDGRRVQFPATLLTPFVTGGGIRGNFVLTCGDGGTRAQLQRR